MQSISPVFKHTWGGWPHWQHGDEIWPPSDVEIDPTGDVGLYLGNLPFLDAIFGHRLNIKTMNIATSAIRILNLMGIRPRLMQEMGSSGHDLYWSGRTAASLRTARRSP